MTVEELYGRVWRELAAKEGHRPLHLIVTTTQADCGKKRGPVGVTAAKVRELCHAGMTLKEAADALGMVPSTVHKHAQRLGVTFRQEPREANAPWAKKRMAG